MPAPTPTAAALLREALPAAPDRLVISYSGPLRVDLGTPEAALSRPVDWPLPPAWKRLADGLLTLDEAPAVEGVRLELPTLQELTYSGWGLLVVKAQQAIPHLRLRLRGAGRLQFEGHAERLEVELAGAGTLLLGGQACELHVLTSGSGDVQAAELQSREARLQLGGSGRCRIWVEEHLRVETSGCGEVAYSGWPRIASEGIKTARLVNVN